MKKTLMLAAAALAFAGCADDAPDAVVVPPVGEAEVVTPPADDAEMDSTLTDDDLMEPMEDAGMTEGETVTDDAM